MGLAAMAAAAVVLNRSERASTSVIAFAKDALVLQALGETRPPAALVDDLLSLRGKGRTDLALALRTASDAARAPAGGRAPRDPALRLPLDRRIGPADAPWRAWIASMSWARATTRNPLRRAVHSPYAREVVTDLRRITSDCRPDCLRCSRELSVEASGRMVA